MSALPGAYSQGGNSFRCTWKRATGVRFPTRRLRGLAMKRKFEELRENLDEFVQQDEYPMLVVGCLSQELAYVVKFLQGLEDKHPQNYFVVFPQPYDDPGHYLDGVVESVRLQVEAAGPMRAERGEPPFPPLPPTLSDPRRTPAQRLEAVLHYLRGLLPNEDEHRVVVGLLPLSCKDFESYGKLMTSIMPMPTVQPWMKALRIVAYDDRTHKKLAAGMRASKVEHVLTFDVDFSTPALTDALAHDAADPSIPVPERMSCLMQLAALDYSYKRYPDALEKYGLLFKYYETEKVPAMQALALLGAGDTLRAAGSLKLAKQRLQQGIAIGMEHKVLPVLLNLFLSVTGVCMQLSQFDEAESYADSGAKVAAAVLNPFAYADMHELKGDAQIAQGKLADGLTTYKRCQELCKTYEHFHRWISVLERQKKLYEDAHLGRERREVEHEILLVRELEKRGGSRPPGARA